MQAADIAIGIARQRAAVGVIAVGRDIDGARRGDQSPDFHNNRGVLKPVLIEGELSPGRICSSPVSVA